MRLFVLALAACAAAPAAVAMPSDVRESLESDPSAFPLYECAGAKSFHLALTAGGSALVRLDTKAILDLAPKDPNADPESQERYEGGGWTLVVNGLAAQLNQDGKPAYEACATKPLEGSPR